MSGKLIAFWAPCSGSGVTTLCARIGALLSRTAPTAAVDLNLSEPSLGTVLDVLRHARPPAHLDSLLPLLRGRRAGPDSLREHALPVPGHGRYVAFAGPLHPFAALQVQEDDIHSLLDILVTHFPIVVADLSPTLDSVATWPVLERAEAVIWVLGAQYPARYHTGRYLPLRRQLRLDGAGVILALNCIHPVPAAQVEDELGVRPDVVIPYAPSLRDLGEAGRLAQPGPQFARALEQLAGLIAPGPDRPARFKALDSAGRAS